VKKIKNKNLIFGVLIVLTITILFGAEKRNVPLLLESRWNITQEVKDEGLEEYTIETFDFDYRSKIILDKASSIKNFSETPFDAIKNTIEYVAKNIRYNSTITPDYCYEEKASTVLYVGHGDCVSMSKLATALLRAQGIPARTVGGCLSPFGSCTQLFAVTPYIEAQVTEMQEGDFKKRGFLHEWVEVWEPSHGWMTVEATSGQIFPLGCSSYYMYSYDTDRYNRCVISNVQFWYMCRKL